ncbi:TIGR04063 family PEP-CTERM/XrtA system glycosyltransferase [Sphingomonas sp. NIBR02145]|uniref:TIGR04063 family PEP-CTERM/XrtA system glycosyltransferase n=1 Tax=Sphingomonas sp. NIBR02145 TaxID=3014784 RepID=UPI0022B48076|nr:TIGR04063 family PEP-CTERM/XrtA system glycosyltransferase [Sphingomonas sp. NIBR02145]WHU00767.1 glycosyltransferase, exosortase A system-associated [Sphingomonas sp. NIBR02145]
MRILHILDHGLPLHSGYTFRTRAILKAQMARGWEVAAVTSPRHGKFDTDEETIDGIRFYRTPRVNSGPPVIGELREVSAFAKRIEAVARQWQPDVLHAHSPVLGAMAAQRVANRLGLPLIYEIRAFWEDAAVGNGTGTEGSWKYRATRWLETRAVRKADAVAVICEGLKNDLLSRGGIDAGKIMISPNGVDLGLFGEPLPHDTALAKELGIEGAETIGFIGSFYDYEGLDGLIEAMPALVALRPKMHLVLVGGGPCDAALMAQAAASPVADRIHFVGRVPHQQVERYYSVIDVLVYPRKHMRLTDLVTPLKPLEAMAQRRLVAASDVGGHRELIRDGDTGTLFKPDDPAALADSVARLFGAREGWDSRRERGRAFVETERSWAINVGRYDSVYQRLAKIGAMEDSWSHTSVVSA